MQAPHRLGALAVAFEGRPLGDLEILTKLFVAAGRTRDKELFAEVFDTLRNELMRETAKSIATCDVGKLQAFVDFLRDGHAMSDPDRPADPLRAELLLRYDELQAAPRTLRQLAFELKVDYGCHSRREHLRQVANELHIPLVPGPAGRPKRTAIQ